MPYKISCNWCSKWIYIEEIQQQNTNYVCDSCNGDNWLAGKYAGFIEVDENEFISTTTDSKPCPNCDKMQNAVAKFCRECGTEISPKEKITIAYCEECKTEYEESSKYCQEDGNELVIKEKELDESPNNIKSYSSAISESQNQIEKDQIDDLPMNWYKFITYFLFPIAILGYLYIATLNINEIVNLSMLIAALFGGIIIYGLHNKMDWSWKLVVLSYFLNVTTSKIDKVEDIGILAYLIVIVIMNFLITYPNYIYFNKRKHLFNN